MVAYVYCIQLFQQTLFHKSVKAYATKPIGIMGSKSLALLDEVHSVEHEGRINYEYMGL